MVATKLSLFLSTWRNRIKDRQCIHILSWKVVHATKQYVRPSNNDMVRSENFRSMYIVFGVVLGPGVGDSR